MNLMRNWMVKLGTSLLVTKNDRELSTAIRENSLGVEQTLMDLNIRTGGITSRITNHRYLHKYRYMFVYSLHYFFFEVDVHDVVLLSTCLCLIIIV